MKAFVRTACLSAVLLSSPAFAASAGPAPLLGEGQVMRGAFRHEHPSVKLGRVIQTEGRFVLAPPEGAIWSVQKPIPMSFVETPAGMTQFVGNLPLMQIKPDKMPFLADITLWLHAAMSGQWSALESDFKVQKSGTPQNWTVVLTPKATAGSLPVKKVTARGGKTLDSADLLLPNGETDRVTFTDETIASDGPTPQEAAFFEGAKATAKSKAAVF